VSSYPKAVDSDRVGEYPALAKSGAGYFYDDVLEYRVWCHPERGAPDEFEGEDYYYAFETYEEAMAFSEATQGSETPLVLIRQFEWINEPVTGTYIHEKGERIAEWQVQWLAGGKRGHDQSLHFLRPKTIPKHMIK
jgi:putative acetyltransferase